MEPLHLALLCSRVAQQVEQRLRQGRRGGAVLQQLGVTESCPQPARSESGAGKSDSTEVPAAGAARDEPATPGSALSDIWDWLVRFFREVLRVLEQWSTMPQPLPREAPPANLPASCRTFHSQADLDARKAHWAGVVAALPTADVVSWMIGLAAPHAAAAAHTTTRQIWRISRPRAPRRLGAPLRQRRPAARCRPSRTRRGTGRARGTARG